VRLGTLYATYILITPSYRPEAVDDASKYCNLLHEHQVRAKNIFGATEDFGASVEQALLAMTVENFYV